MVTWVVSVRCALRVSVILVKLMTKPRMHNSCKNVEIAFVNFF